MALAFAFYLAAVVAVALGLMAAVWIGVIFTFGFAAVLAVAWVTK